MPEVVDPVCGVAFDEETAEALGACRVEHGGRTRWFCCPTCQREFLADPAQYG